MQLKGWQWGAGCPQGQALSAPHLDIQGGVSFFSPLGPLGGHRLFPWILVGDIMGGEGWNKADYRGG